MLRRFGFVVLLCSVNFTSGQYDVIYAVNAGSGTATTDSLGIRYESDTLDGSVPCGSSASLKDVPLGDKKLYDHVQHGDFGYGFNFPDDGYYTIVLKFADCWTAAINQRLFDISLNQRKVIEQIDIAKEVGNNTVYTENIRFTVCDGKLYLSDGEHVPVFNKHVRLDFLATPHRWKPIVNALVVLKQTNIDEDLSKALGSTKKAVLPFYECKIVSQSPKTVMVGPGQATIFNIYGPITFNIFNGPKKTETIADAELD